MKILIACQSAANQGDRAIADYLIRQLSALGHEIVLSTTQPALWKTGLAADISVIGMGYWSPNSIIRKPFIGGLLRGLTRWLWNPILFADLMAKHGGHPLCRMVSSRFIEAVRDADLVIVTGGHHITSFREKNALFQFTYDIGLVQIFAGRYILWSQTVGPLTFTSARAKAFIKGLLLQAECVYLRDESSMICAAETVGTCANTTRTCDSVFGFGMADYPSLSDREKKVGVSIFDGLKKAFAAYETIAAMLDRYASDGYTIEFFRMEYGDAEADSIRRVISLMKTHPRITVHPFMTSTEEHLCAVASCRCFIGYKTHSVIMALTTATPLIAIAYHPKTADFMHDFGLDAYVLPDETLRTEQALRCIDLLEQNLAAVHQTEREIAREMAQRVQNDVYEMVRHD
ncbi:MAG: hypothetical protein E7604_03540 [Ruminococcaceae bacterium]|nr:hypothetical protein [Oscillospiraceae bacterium]